MIANINMLLHRETDFQVAWGDTIRLPMLLEARDQLRKFDVVISNPPWSMPNWGSDQVQFDQFDRFHRGLPPKNYSNFAFISHMVETLKEDTGRMAVVVPHGVLFRSRVEQKIRKALIKENLLEAIIGLPSNLHQNTAIPTAILIFKKNKSDRNLLFIDAANEFVSVSRKKTLGANNIQEIVNAYEARKEIEHFAHLATLDEVEENEYDLSIKRYINSVEREEDHEPGNATQRTNLASSLNPSDRKAEETNPLSTRQFIKSSVPISYVSSTKRTEKITLESIAVPLWEYSNRNSLSADFATAVQNLELPANIRRLVVGEDWLQALTEDWLNPEDAETVLPTLSNAINEQYGIAYYGSLKNASVDDIKAISDLVIVTIQTGTRKMVLGAFTLGCSVMIVTASPTIGSAIGESGAKIIEALTDKIVTAIETESQKLEDS
ncbi:hypothetical protein GCM10007094_22900 [Pseudovibrio japonicus]|uniref:site-specific DNA-methyltransferase (adenine-specific) n=1 Tax=Pseudovibrio japonicus TaxID=366534 RepID=A0ABQ3ECD9_9HYPH|nr:hypothetical protein GCM10007094_22900 [Pseudovibrio japonicus]